MGRTALLGVKSAPRYVKGRKSGLSRSWKRFGKKARMKIAKKIRVFLNEVSCGIEFLV